MPMTETAPIIMKSETKNHVENLIHDLLFNVAHANGESLRSYEHLLGQPSDMPLIHSKFHDNPMGRLREALQVYEEKFIEKCDGGPPVCQSLEKIIRASNKLDGPMTAEQVDAVQSAIAGAWEETAQATGNWKLAQQYGFDTIAWSD